MEKASKKVDWRQTVREAFKDANLVALEESFDVADALKDCVNVDKMLLHNTSDSMCCICGISESTQTKSVPKILNKLNMGDHAECLVVCDKCIDKYTEFFPLCDSCEERNVLLGESTSSTKLRFCIDCAIGEKSQIREIILYN